MGTKSGTIADRFVAERIRALRLQLGMSQTTLGEKLGVTFQQIQKYEKGVNRVGAGRLLDIARIFHVPIQAFFPEIEEGTDGAQPDPELAKMSELLLSTEGQRLCRAFLRLRDHRLKKRIIDLIEDVSAT